MGKWSDLRVKLVNLQIERVLVEKKLRGSISQRKRGRCNGQMDKLNMSIQAIEAQFAQRQPRVSTPTPTPSFRFADYSSFVPQLFPD